MRTGMFCRRTALLILAVAAVSPWAGGVFAQNRTFSFAYDQPTTTAYGIAANIFDAKLKELAATR